MPLLDDLQNKGGAFGVSLFSKTKEGGVYKSPKMTINGVSTTLKLRDTVGFGAMDMKTNDILKRTLLDLVSDFDKTRVCILVYKCERYREGGHKDLEEAPPSRHNAHRSSVRGDEKRIHPRNSYQSPSRGPCRQNHTHQLC